MSEDKSIKKSDNESGIYLKKGYITFLDILGWKGIWRDKEDKQIISLVRILRGIRDECRLMIDDFLFDYLLNLSKNELKEFFQTAEKQIKLKNVKEKKEIDMLRYPRIILIGQEPNVEIDVTISKLFEHLEDISKQISQLTENLNKNIKIEDSQKKLERAKAKESELEEEYNALGKIIDKKREEFDIAYKKYEIIISVELISDTFVITSNSKNKEIELYMHTNIVKKLIGECLKNDMLIRGATSYGDYYNEEKVFVGSAVDDAASWHEQGDEIGVFFTPKGYLSTKEIAQRCLKEKLLREKTPYLKNKSQALKLILWIGANTMSNIKKLYHQIHIKQYYLKSQIK